MSANRAHKVVRALLAGLTAVGASGGLVAAGTAHASGPVTITLGTWGGAAENSQLLQILQGINARNKKSFRIVDQNVNTNYEQKLTVELAAGTAPDIFYVNNSMMPTFEKEGALLDITPWMKRLSGYYHVADPKNYFPVTLTNAVYHGHYYGLPWIAMPVVVYWNPVLFKKAHLAPPTPNWTWQTFLKDAKAMTDPKKGIYGFLQANGWPPVHLYIWSYGGHILNANGTRATIDSPQAIRGLSLMASFVKEGVIPPQSAIANVAIEDLFRAGKIGMFIGGADDGVYHTQGFKAKIAMIPRGTQPTNFLWMADLAVNAHAKHLPQVMQAYFQLLTAIDHWKIVSPVKTFATAQVIRSINLHDPYAPGDHTPPDRIPVILDSLKYARRYRMLHDPTLMSKYWTVLSNDIYEPILLGKATPAQAAAQAEKDLNAIISGSGS